MFEVSFYLLLTFDVFCFLQCPLCMEQLEMDDINFFPCTCGYQVCTGFHFFKYVQKS